MTPNFCINAVNPTTGCRLSAGNFIHVSVLVSPTGWGELSGPHAKSENSWGEHAPSPVSVDNGTSAWVKPTGSSGGWGEGNSDNYTRSNPAMTSASCKPGKHLYFVYLTLIKH